MAYDMRHYATYNREDVIVLGYNKGQNAVMIVRVGNLPGEEQMEIRRIASSNFAQSRDYLAPVLQEELHKSKTDWFTYLAHKMHRNDGTVLMVSIKDISDLNPDQNAFFKGYGTSVQSNPVSSTHAGSDVPNEHEYVSGESSPNTNAGSDVPNEHEYVSGESSTDVMLLSILSKIEQGQNRIQETLGELVTEVKSTRKTTRKKTSAKRPRAKKPESQNQVVNESDYVNTQHSDL